FGARWQGYCSDLTRTVVLGPASDEQQAMYETVLRAQSAGIGAVAPGTSCRDVDRAAREVIESQGHGDDFAHGLGHGVGLDIHEAPKLHRISEESLLAGDVVTIEPGIYVRDRGGVRIEDCVLVTDGGAEVLGSAPKDHLIEL
ncbi:MAG TPA: M24 family metallopeptidase, partial [Actinomycetota bacterium]|nr:M24 family metallopeptidase [Actinomycetota bacterium]